MKIPNCKTCKHWKQNTHFEGVLNTGVCDKLPDFEKMEISLNMGWDGEVETEEDFGCTLHEINH
jgi:hypothetical protein